MVSSGYGLSISEFLTTGFREFFLNGHPLGALLYSLATQDSILIAAATSVTSRTMPGRFDALTRASPKPKNNRTVLSYQPTEPPRSPEKSHIFFWEEILELLIKSPKKGGNNCPNKWPSIRYLGGQGLFLSHLFWSQPSAIFKPTSYQWSVADRSCS